jgi:ABC-type iron transport system FetAB permease component
MEMMIVTTWTKLVAETRILASGVVTIINIFIWYYVLETILHNINDWKVVMLYALGCALGTVMTTYYFKLKEDKLKEAKPELS